jgi:cobalt/nickel transport protein
VRKHLVTVAIVLTVVAIFVVALMLGAGHGDQGGTDAAAGAAIESSGYRPWFELPFRIPGGEVESGLFAMQAALGGIVLGFVVGKLHERRKGKRA